jgi:hypothetical protein
LLVVAVACTAKDGAEGGATPASGDDAGDSTSMGELGCEAEFFLCPIEISFRAGAFDSCLSTQESVYDAQRVFDALVAETPLSFEIQMSSSSPDSECASLDSVLVIGDGTAVTSRSTGAQFGKPVYTRRVEIKPPAFFESCAATDDPTALTVCLREWFVPDTCIAPLCCPVGELNRCE